MPVHKLSYRQWTRREEELCVLWDEGGVCRKDIAVKLGRTVDSLRARIPIVRRRLGKLTRCVDRRHSYGGLTAAVKYLSRPGLTDSMVAAIIGVKRESVLKVRQRHRIAAGLKAGGKVAYQPKRSAGHEWQKGELQTLVMVYMALNHGLGLPDDVIAERLNRSAKLIQATRNNVLRHLEEF